MTSASMVPQSGVSGPAYATATPRSDPIPAASASGPTARDLRAAWEAYKGAFKGPLTQLSSQPDLNVLANRCGPIVRTGVDFLFGPVLKLEHPTPAAQAILDAAWGDEDRRMTLLSKCRINGGVYGHVFIKIVTPKNKKPLSADNPPRLVAQNPEFYTVDTDPDDCDLVTRYICTYQATDASGQPCWKRQTTTRVDPDDPDLSEGNNYNDPLESERDADAHWEIQNWVKLGASGDESGTWEADGPVMLWPFPFAPLVDWQNYPNPNDHWGARDIDDAVVNLNRQLHLVESNTNSVMYSHGHPWLFSTGADTTSITPTPGAITDLGSPDAKIQAITAAGDTAHMMEFAAQIRADMDEATSTPSFMVGRATDLPRGPIPGITVRLYAMSRLMRMEHERRLYGCGIRELCRAVLILCGQEAAAAEDVQLNWQEPLPQDDLAMAQMALTMSQVGVSQHSIYAMMGLDYDTEQTNKEQEAQDQMRAQLQGGALPALDMPPTQPGGATGQQFSPTAGGDDANNANNNGQPQPPVNHPAAVAARAAAKAAGAAIKARGGTH